MARYKTYDYDQTHLIPVCLADQLLKGSLEHAIHVLVEKKMDTSIFDCRYHNDKTGCPAYNPKILLKVVLFAYSHGIVGSRRIEKLCRKHVICMALACMQHPDHSSIAAFVSSMHQEILSLFRDILLACAEQQLLGGTVFALDGLKLPSNASKRWSGTIDELKHKQEKLEARIQQLLTEHQQVDAGQAKQASTPESSVSSEAEGEVVVSESAFCKNSEPDNGQCAQQADDAQQASESQIDGTVKVEVPADEEADTFNAQVQASGKTDLGLQDQQGQSKRVKARGTGKGHKTHKHNSRRHHKKQSKGDKHKRAERLKRLRRHVERTRTWLANNEAKIGRQGKEIKSNITDNESAKMSSSHGVIQGYNVQAVVDGKHQVIVAAEAFGDGQDGRHLSLMMPGLKENIKAIGLGDDYLEGKQFLSDSNYFSDANLKTCEDEKLDAYIPDCNFRKRDPRFADQKRYKPKKKKRQKKRFGLDDFTYDEATKCYRCPNGKLLRLRVHEHRLKHRVYRRYVANEEDCWECPLRNKCLSQKKTKRKHLGIPVDEPVTKEKSRCQKMIEKIDTTEGKQRYSQRLPIVEPVFANIRTQKGLDHFTLRGKQKVDIQWTLYALVHNIEKLANYGNLT
jgi:transposase